MQMISIRMFAALFASGLLLSGCGRHEVPKPAKRIDTVQEAVTRIGDVTIRANVVLTSSLNEAVAHSYGIERSDHRVMLLVAVRQGAENQEAALPATIDASVSTLQGQRQSIALREVRTGELLDAIGTVDISPPETLTFDLKIVREGGAASTMTFSRDFSTE